MAPEFGQWAEVLSSYLVSERDALQAKIHSERRRVAAMERELAAAQDSISVNTKKVKILTPQITAARNLSVISSSPLEVPGTEASLRDFILRQSDLALGERDDSKVQEHLEAQAKLTLAGSRLVRVGFDPDRKILVPKPKIMVFDKEKGFVQIGDDPPMRISPKTVLCLGLFYNNPEKEIPVQSIEEQSGGRSGPNTLEKLERRLGIPVFRKERRGKANTFWSFNLDWILPLSYIEQIQRREKVGFAVLDAVVSQVSQQSVPAYLDLHRVLGPSGNVDVYSERIHRISDDSQTRILEFYTADELVSLFTPYMKELFEQSKEDSKKALWDDIKVQIWNKIASLMERFKVSRYDAFLGKLSRAIKDSEQVYNEANSIKTPVKSAIL